MSEDRMGFIFISIGIVFVVLFCMFMNDQMKKCEVKGGVYLINEYKCVSGIKELK